VITSGDIRNDPSEPDLVGQLAEGWSMWQPPCCWPPWRVRRWMKLAVERSTMDTPALGHPAAGAGEPASHLPGHGLAGEQGGQVERRVQALPYQLASSVLYWAPSRIRLSASGKTGRPPS
jgi:hypothetical protein